MASDCSKVEQSENGNLIVTLADKVNKDFCSKPERKQLIESILAELTKQSVKVEFLAAKKDPQREAVQPKLTRVQQIRQLEGNDFVKNALSIFERKSQTSNKDDGANAITRRLTIDPHQLKPNLSL